jgi:multiple sugar transport system substrate-binding protein
MPGDTSDGRDGTDDRATAGGRLSRRRFVVAAGATGVTGFAGCTGGTGSGSGSSSGGGSGGEQSGSDGARTGGSGGTAQQITAAAASGTGGLVERLFEEYVTPQTGIDIEMTVLPYSNLFDKLSTSLSNESASFDLFAMDDPWMPRLAQYLAPVEEYMDDIPTDQLIDSTLEIGTWPPEAFAAPPGADGEPRLRALCAVGNSHIFVYNQAYYEQVGVGEPSTWADVLEAGKRIGQEIDGAQGYAIRGKNGNPITAAYFSPGMSMAGPMFSDGFQFDWADQQGVEAADFFLNDLRSISPDGVSSWDSEQVLNSLGQGRTAAAPQWPSGASVLIQEDKSAEYDNIAFTGIPEGNARSAAQQGNWLLGINQFSSEPKKQAAGDVIRSFISREGQQRYVELGGVPFRHDTFENNMDAAKWMPALYQSLQNAVPRPRTALWAEIETTIGKALNRGLVDELSPEAAMERANSRVESLLSENGYYD